MDSNLTISMEDQTEADVPFFAFTRHYICHLAATQNRSVVKTKHIDVQPPNCLDLCKMRAFLSSKSPC